MLFLVIMMKMHLKITEDGKAMGVLMCYLVHSRGEFFFLQRKFSEGWDEICMCLEWRCVADICLHSKNQIGSSKKNSKRLENYTSGSNTRAWKPWYCDATRNPTNGSFPLLCWNGQHTLLRQVWSMYVCIFYVNH